MKKLVIAVDLGATNVRVALVSESGQILKPKRERTSKEGEDGRVVTDQIIELIVESTQGENWKNILGIGISSIGPLDYTKGGPTNSPNVPFPLIPLVAPLEKTFSLPVSLYNDASAAALAEKHFGDGKDIENLVYITISTGIGGGAIVDGRLLFGKGGNAAEIGHLVVDTTYNLLCTCKSKKGYGHWEILASGTNIPKFFCFWKNKEGKETSFEVEEAKDIFDQAHKGDKTALEFLEELSRVNARAISSIIVAYAPELITIGGSVALNNEDLILPGIKRHVDDYLEVPEIKITTLGENITLLGAVAAVFKAPEACPG